MVAYAFPFAHGSEDGAMKTHSHGMTLKDWFAGQIIAAMLGSDPSNSSQRDNNGQLCQMDPAKLANMAKSAYQAAEALLQVRATNQNEQ
jgi:hypothetical protein